MIASSAKCLHRFVTPSILHYADGHTHLPQIIRLTALVTSLVTCDRVRLLPLDLDSFGIQLQRFLRIEHRNTIDYIYLVRMQV